MPLRLPLLQREVPEALPLLQLSDGLQLALRGFRRLILPEPQSYDFAPIRSLEASKANPEKG